MPYDLYNTANRYKILRRDSGLAPYSHEIVRRMQRYEETLARIKRQYGGLQGFADGHNYFGFHQLKGEWIYREWAPAASAVALFGDFTGWQKGALPLQSLGDGVWELRRPGLLPHASLVRIRVKHGGKSFERIPLYIKRAVQNPDTLSFNGQVWAPQTPYQWRHGGISEKRPLLVYECHIGMASEEEKIAGFAEFTRDILPRIAAQGYNAIQIMGVMEHPYYASYGYQVSNFFAVSSRFGTPEDFKALVDEAHRLDIAVILDLVHSHAAKNEVEGIGRFDGTYAQFFHEGPRGEHPDWNSRLFHYGNPGVQRFLLSNLRFWLQEYHLDGFRFDGVTSMLYHDHGRGVFNGYAQYFGPNTDMDAAVYLMLATGLCRAERPGCLLLAEDMSGMPGMALPVAEGGFGFGYRLGMGAPDFWIRTLQKRDEDWSMGELWHELAGRRPGEAVVGYCECHDQAMVGDKTLLFRMADSAMYTGMQVGSQSPVVERAVALHKMIRLVTFALAGEGYLNFMGNEFGHPEWIDFPRAGNGNSYFYARRQWSLADNPKLRYKGLAQFDKAMLALATQRDALRHTAQQMVCDDYYKLLYFRKGTLLFCFNFHHGRAAPLPAIAANVPPLLYTDSAEFGGGQALPGNGLLPRRTAAVFSL